MKYDKELLDEFVAEAKEHLSDMEDELLSLERGSPDPKLVDKVFRAIHSIKGAAGFLGLRKVNDLSHVMETVLQMLRSGEAKPNSKLVDALLAGVDALNGMLADIEASEKVEIQKILDKLGSLLAKQVSPKARKELQRAVKIVDADGRPAGFEVSEFVLKNRPKEHEFLYIFKYDLQELQSKGGVSPLALVKELLSMGEILSASLNTSAKSLSEDLSKHSLRYEVLYSTVLEPELAVKASKLPEDRVLRVFGEDDAPAKKGDVEAEAPEAGASVDQEAADRAEEREERKEDSGSAKKSSAERSDTIRMNLSILDKLMTLAGELVLVRNQHLMRFSDSADPAARGISQRLDIVTTELQETIMRTRMQPVGNVFGKLPRIVRDLSAKLGKRIELAMAGEEVELDKTILESLADPLTHIIRNCCDHGIGTPDERAKAGKPEAGHIKVRAFHEGGQINIEVVDDGRGIDPARIKEKALKVGLVDKERLAQMSEKDIVRLITKPGFSTAEKVTDVSGRGVGMDVVLSAIERLGGALDISSAPGVGTTIAMRMPLTLAIIPCLIVGSGGQRYAIPQVNLEELVRLYDGDVAKKIECDNDQEVYRLRERLLPLVRLDEVFARPRPFTQEVKRLIAETRRKELRARIQEGRTRGSFTFAVLKSGPDRFGLVVDSVVGTEEIVVKPMHGGLKPLKIYSGAAVMGDGRCALILDIDGLAAHAGLDFALASSGAKASDAVKSSSAKLAEETQAVLLFKNGPEEQFALPLPLIKRIERIKLSDVQRAGEREFMAIDGVPTRILRIDRVFKVSPCVEREDMYLLMPKHCAKPVGVLVSSLVDIANSPLDLNTDSVAEDGILGSALLKGKMTLYPDIYRMVELLEPEWAPKKVERAGGPKRILLVEDAIFFRQLVRGYLEAGGYAVETAENGREGLERLEAGRFDLLVSDIEMPVMDGWDFIKAVRADGRNAALPAIALTALDGEKDVDKARSAGFDMYQVKIEREALLKAVEDSLKAGRRTNQGGSRK